MSQSSDTTQTYTGSAGQRPMVLAMALMAGLVVINIYCNQPMLPLIASDLGVPKASMGLIPAFTLAGFGSGLFFLLPLGDRFDRRILILIQLALACCFASLAATASDLSTLLVASFGLGFVSVLTQQLVALAAVSAAPSERGRMAGIVLAGISVGILLGRVLGGVISSTYGWRTVFGMLAVGMVVIALGASLILPKAQPASELAYGRLLGSMWHLARDHKVMRDAMLVQGLIWAAFNALWANLATFLAQEPYNLGSAWAGAFGFCGIAGVLSAAFGGQAVDRIGAPRIVIFSILAVIAAYYVLFLAPFLAPWSLVALVIGVIMLDVGVQSGLVSNQSRAFAIDRNAASRINGLYMTAAFTGGAIGAAVSGWLMAQFGWNGVAAFGCAAGLLAGLVHLRYRCSVKE